MSDTILLIELAILIIAVSLIWTRKEDDEGDKVVKSLKTLLVLMISSLLIKIYPLNLEHSKGLSEGKKMVAGLPINYKLEGHTFTPLAFVITEKRVLVYDKDEKVYALDGIKLENGLNPETLTVGTNISYTVYAKNGLLYFGRL